MAQGVVKQKAATAKKSPVKRRGVAIAPKKAQIAKQRALTKKLTGVQIQKTEKLLAAKAGAVGKLTIMKPVAQEAKREKDKDVKKKSK
ncbi:uncharacterized protein BJ171DRAFT_513333 [Polychytrium aggregatum]|uniref:uncharacterized protein n=1 Tax=Polychytrium aggregatum TaxID=110093 RepID=UPI0022FEB44D|nr:uncharacterized protein BJ171DRAFT_513333 [Polychytrium aggregatum]KAI9202520.1 hypothetical protein BJ171DRAFT_513333 [Polychytrium aggregatum]